MSGTARGQDFRKHEALLAIYCTKIKSMDVGCNCFGVATAAKVPVKRYNLLVPAIFPVTEPKPDKPLSVGIEKNIGRLSDYLERNEHRIPKVCCDV